MKNRKECHLRSLQASSRSFLVMAISLASCTPTAEPPDGRDSTVTAANYLSQEEIDSGWQLLFDGKSLEGWRGLGLDFIPDQVWKVDSGALRTAAAGVVRREPDGQPVDGLDVMTEATFRDFDLRFAWRVTPGGNSGVKYNVSEEMSVAHDPPHAALGFEYQVLDDDVHSDGAFETHRAADLYDLVSAGPAKSLRPVGDFNEGRIVLQAGRGEHWLNGVKVLEFDIKSPEFASRFAASKYRDYDGFAEQRSGHIVLQDHGDEVWFRDIKIRRLDAEADAE